MVDVKRELANANRVRFARRENHRVIEFCCHAANVLYLLSYLVRDMLWLRILTCVGLVLGIIFFTCQPTPFYGPSSWHLCFLGINIYQIWRLVRKRRQRKLTVNQERVACAVFHDLSTEELVNLLTHVMCESTASAADIAAITVRL